MRGVDVSPRTPYRTRPRPGRGRAGWWRWRSWRPRGPGQIPSILSLVLIVALGFFLALPAAATQVPGAPPHQGPPPCAPRHLSPAPDPVIAVRALHMRLMVAALSCGTRDAYGRYVHRFGPQLTANGNALRQRFPGPAGATSVDRLVTRLANDAAADSSRAPRVFCARTFETFDRLFQAPASEGFLVRVALDTWAETETEMGTGAGTDCRETASPPLPPRPPGPRRPPAPPRPPDLPKPLKHISE